MTYSKIHKGTKEHNASISQRAGSGDTVLGSHGTAAFQQLAACNVPLCLGYYSCCLQQNHSALNGKRKEVMAEHLPQLRLGPPGICYRGTWTTMLLIF